MNPEEQRQRVLQHLQRAEQIVRDTKEVQSLRDLHDLDPLHGIPPEVIEQVEEEFQTARGRVRHVGADGRLRWLTPEQLEARTKGRKRNKRHSRYYGPTAKVDQRMLIRWAFNIGAVLLGLLIVFVVVL